MARWRVVFVGAVLLLGACGGEDGPSGDDVAASVERRYGITVEKCAREDTNFGDLGWRWRCRLASPRTYLLTGDTSDEWCVILRDGRYELSYPTTLPNTYCPADLS
jgi:hypothetical protein